MKIIKITLSLLLFSTLSFSQEIDRATMKCAYQYVWQNDTITKKTKDDILILQIGKYASKCLSYYSNQVDSLSALPNGDKKIGKMIDDAMKNGDFMKGYYPHKRMKTYVYKNYPKGKVTITDGLSLQDYVYEDVLNAQEWQITTEEKNILGYTCQRANCNFRGRYWTAWFAVDIPVSDGPWKFSGLPGLIMEVYDWGDQHHFTITGLQHTSDEPIFFSPTDNGNMKFEKTNRISFLRAKRKYLMDMNGYIQMETGIDLSRGNVGKVMRYDLIERDY